MMEAFFTAATWLCWTIVGCIGLKIVLGIIIEILEHFFDRDRQF